VTRARIELGPTHARSLEEAPYPLHAGHVRLGTLYTPVEEAGEVGARRRFLAALASLLAVATERERLQRAALEAEALRRSDVVKTAVIRAVSHDLRTPLATMKTALGGLTGDAGALGESDRAELLESLGIELDRLIRLVDNLLDLSRLQAGAARPLRDLWSAEDLIAQALEHVPGSDTVDVVGAADTPPVRVDAAQTQRILVNLIENAVKFSPPGEHVVVAVTATRRELLIRVVDKGPGVPESERELIFQPFHVANGRRGGAGLGLAIAQGFAHANGGRLWVDSHTGQGATFTLALPVAQQAPTPAAVSA
jgi:two-component system sensor histidine kinase KdpD